MSTGIEAKFMGDTLNDKISVGDGSDYEDAKVAAQGCHEILFVRDTRNMPSIAEFLLTTTVALRTKMTCPATPSLGMTIKRVCQLTPTMKHVIHSMRLKE